VSVPDRVMASIVHGRGPLVLCTIPMGPGATTRSACQHFSLCPHTQRTHRAARRRLRASGRGATVNYYPPAKSFAHVTGRLRSRET
jgi:hypothetical protein